ncbi:fumarylacetoacetate hydrolase family protein [Zavarzinella formosa]|uniref:fumarylacetoacetate hydrolase family protein n=1 Tax=Zavarzinella formosa TaxID=360055 RepID=UPI000315CD68|nr:fumarylacetoacetate hydrolase family protein [Zavarzinella formosa]
MRLATLNTPQGPHAAIQVGDSYVDLTATDSKFPASVRELLSKPALLAEAAEAAKSPKAVKVPVAGAKLHAPIHDPQKIVCVGLNYRDHAIESKMAIPKEPVLFSKFPSALIGSGEAIVAPKVSTRVDYEAELVIVIGKKGRKISEADATDHVAGYAVGHDVSARDWQLEKDGKQWMAGKTFDTFAPIGPVMVTKDEVADVHNLGIRLRLNGKTMQNSNTKEFIFTVPQMVSYISQIITLEPGDLIFTGTPPGIGHALSPQVYMKAGDTVEVEIDGLGTLTNTVISD